MDDQINANGNADERDQHDQSPQVDLPSATIIGTNLTGINAGTFPGAIVAPAAQLAAEEAEAQESDQVDLDKLSQFGSARRETGDDGVSPAQRELEADKMNG